MRPFSLAAVLIVVSTAATAHAEVGLERANPYFIKGSLALMLSQGKCDQQTAQLFMACGNFEMEQKPPSNVMMEACMSRAAKCWEQLDNPEAAVAAYSNQILSYVISRQQGGTGNKKFDAEMDSKEPKARLRVGPILRRLGRIDEALDHYNKAKPFIEKAARSKSRDALIDAYILNKNIGAAYNHQARVDEGIPAYMAALRYAEQLGIEGYIVDVWTDLVEAYRVQGNLTKAEAAAQKARQHASKLSKSQLAPFAGKMYNNEALVWSELGWYDKALESFQTALGFLGTNEHERRAVTLGNIGTVYQDWGRYADALEYSKKAYALVEQHKLGSYAASSLNNLFGPSEKLGKLQDAKRYATEAVAAAKEHKQLDQVAISLNNLGSSEQSLGDLRAAEAAYRASIEAAQQAKLPSVMLASLSNLAGIYINKGAHAKARGLLTQAIALAKQVRAGQLLATLYANLGAVDVIAGKPKDAIANLEEAIAMIEQLRKTAPGPIRRDYLAAQFINYQGLVAAYVRSGEAKKAFEAIELSRAKFLSEQLAGKGQRPNLATADEIIAALPADVALVAYANPGWDKITQIVLTKEGAFAHEVSTKDKLSALAGRLSGDIAKLPVRSRGIKKKSTAKRSDPYGADSRLEPLIQLYRARLEAPGASADDLRPIARALHELLLAPIHKRLAGKRRLIIIPAGEIAFLPFETLVDGAGKYAVERFELSYAPSMGVLSLIQGKAATGTRPVLTFGGAAYGPAPSNSSIQLASGEEALRALGKRVSVALEANTSLAPSYAALGLDQWTPIDGTRVEAESIAALVGGSRAVLGEDVTEARIKSMSAAGDLAEYRVLHFATHGIAVPEVPELSALILSETKKPGSAEDGYLSVDEIAHLRLGAEFVNLSACQTGLGRLMQGEGVVGLSQAFMIAGAKSLSVSLWDVPDEATAKLMRRVYTSVFERNLSFDAAMTEAKRAAIRGELGAEATGPHFWAPFVFYGAPSGVGRLGGGLGKVVVPDAGPARPKAEVPLAAKTTGGGSKTVSSGGAAAASLHKASNSGTSTKKRVSSRRRDDDDDMDDSWLGVLIGLAAVAGTGLALGVALTASDPNNVDVNVNFPGPMR